MQSAKPVPQTGAHCPVTQARLVVFADEHAPPHAPQCATLLSRFVSQPSSAEGAAGWVQLPKGAAQAEVHAPALHASAETPASEQVRPQAPQWVTSLVMSVSQPSSAAGAVGWLQSPKPLAQTGAHTPDAQAWAVVPASAQA